MPDHDYPTPTNAFTPDFLNQLAQHADPVTADEAMTGGFWRVVPLDDEHFGLFRVWENPEDGDEPFATLSDRDTALLAPDSGDRHFFWTARGRDSPGCNPGIPG